MIPSKPPQRPNNNHLKSHLLSTNSKLYQPSIYRYTCVGAYSATSQQRFSEGKCTGFRSRLELLSSDMGPATRQAALQDFTYMTFDENDMDDPRPASGGGDSAGGASDASLSQQPQSVLVSPALIYKQTDDDEKDKEKDEKKMASSLLPEEELIKSQTWNCYGSTEVEYLVLKDLDSPSSEERIVAVAPRNAGVSIRKIDTDETSLTSIGIGWLNIVVDTGPLYEDDLENNNNNDDDKQKRPNHHRHDATMSHSPEEVPPKPPVDALTAAKASLERLGSFSGKVLEQMQKNVVWLSQTLQDDFPQRTVTAGTKIVDQFPKTVQRTGKYMGKMANRLFGDEPDDSDEDDGPRPGGPTPSR